MNILLAKIKEKDKINLFIKGRKKLHSDNVKIKTFLAKGLKCANCNLEATELHIEIDERNNFHYNFYIIQDDSKEMLTVNCRKIDQLKDKIIYKKLLLRLGLKNHKIIIPDKL
jgi:hypothetical protein